MKGKQLRIVALKEVHNKEIEKLKKNDGFKEEWVLPCSLLTLSN